ncbi:MAG: hypothetical protein IT210_05780 [Armatimonadetes bacterium]|nr:hypothetical protein [Armatimonadota bacterium]
MPAARPYPTLRRCLLLWLIGGGTFAKSLHDRLGDPDIWFHVRAGEYLLQYGCVPRTGIFSYSAADRPWIAHEWLASLLFALIHRLGGPLGLLLWRSLMLALVFAAIYFIARQRGGAFYPAFFVAALAMAGTLEFWGERAYLWTYLLFLLWNHLLWRGRHECLSCPGERRLRFLWPLPLTMLLWVNLHGAFPLGFLSMAAYWIGDWIEERLRLRAGAANPSGHRRFRQALLAAALPSLLAVPLNPNGFAIVGFVSDLLRTPAITVWIEEWRQPDFHNLLLFIPFALWLACLAAALTRRKTDMPEVILAAATLSLALGSVRHIPLCYLAAGPLIACTLPRPEEWRLRFPALAARLSGPPRPESPLANWAAALFLIAFTALLSPKGTSFADCTRPDAYPVAAADFIERRGIGPPILNQDDWGGYLIWRFGGRLPVFHDTRAEIYGDDLGMEYIRTANLLPGWRQVFRKYRFQAVLWEPEARLPQALTQSPDWYVAYSDPVAVVLLPRQP